MANKAVKRDTNTDLMLAVMDLVKQNGCYEKAEQIMDYFLPEEMKVQEITDCRFDFCAIVNFGASEGIYIDCFISGYYDTNINKSMKLPCGTFKTLRDDLEAMQIMGELAGALTYWANYYVNREIDRY